MTGPAVPLARVAMGANSGRSYPQMDAGSVANLYYTAVGGADTAHPFATTPAAETAPRPSPDGTLLAYLSDETGIDELYVQRFPLGGERLAVSKTGASPARWSHDGRSLFYFDGRGTLMAASITSRPTLAIGRAREIPTDVSPGGLGPGRSNYMFDVAADGRIILAEDVPGAFDLVLVRNGLATEERR